MNNLNLVNNEFLRQFEIQTENSLARIEYSEQERKIFLTKIHIPKEIKDKSLKYLNLYLIKNYELYQLHPRLQDLYDQIVVIKNYYL